MSEDGYVFTAINYHSIFLFYMKLKILKTKGLQFQVLISI